MRTRNDLDWLRDRGVQIDEKGRVIVHLPDPELECEVESDEPSIAELMRHDVDLRQAGSRKQRRRRAAKHSVDLASRRCVQSTRLGRPLLGVVRRVGVGVSISRRTHDLLTQHHMSLADLLDECAQELGHAC